jgi:hypothetical protein
MRHRRGPALMPGRSPLQRAVAVKTVPEVNTLAEGSFS